MKTNTRHFVTSKAGNSTRKLARRGQNSHNIPNRLDAPERIGAPSVGLRIHLFQYRNVICLLYVSVPNAVNQFVVADTERDHHYQHASQAAAAAERQDDDNQNRLASSANADDPDALQPREEGASRRSIDDVADISPKR